mgnify:FL=1
MRRSVIVSDAGPLIALACCHQLELLTVLFDSVHIPQTVLDETTADLTRPGARNIAAFAAVHIDVHPDSMDPFYQSVVPHLDEGEAQALSLARQISCCVLMDERKGRKSAAHHNILVIGTLGVLLQAKQLGVIGEVAPLLQLIQGNGYRLSQKLIDRALHLAGE